MNISLKVFSFYQAGVTNANTCNLVCLADELQALSQWQTLYEQYQDKPLYLCMYQQLKSEE